MKTVQVHLGERSYTIRIGPGATIETMLPWLHGRRCLLISDANVMALLGDRGEAMLTAAGAIVGRAVVPAGEQTKSLAHAAQLYDAALAHGLDRGSCIVALGGGMVGDLAGFVAGTYLRGIPFLQMPTTLLAMVDSSVGVKTGVNLAQGKNLIGVFYQPREVVVDLDALASLPTREYVSGLAEVIKYGVIWDAELFASLEGHVAQLAERDDVYLTEVVARCCQIKADVVQKDERDGGLRAILNYGHTMGHAIEQVAGYGAYLHGEAIAIGMRYAGLLSRDMGGLKDADRQRVDDLLVAVGLPIAFTGEVPEWRALRQAMSTDKKTTEGVPKFVLARELGRVDFGCEVSEELIKTHCNNLIKL
ncbi:MAG: 3-dehydroquinate synthase [Verrucomicrobia bacterium]|nr:3-dehydroquinate synthase [Verrucomicrobiota bacterium]